MKLMWVLGQTTELDEVRELMGRNIAGEIKGRRVPTEDDYCDSFVSHLPVEQ